MREMQEGRWQVFDSLSKKILGVFERLSGRGKIGSSDIAEAFRDIRIALLEADVSLPVVKDILARIEEKARGQKVIESVRPADQVVKIVNDELVEILGGDARIIDAAKVVMLVGLNGSGKTTTAMKLAKYFKDKGRSPLLASTDVYRPQAREQLALLASRVGADSLPMVDGEGPADIARRALKSGADVLILDTAGRISVDKDMMAELASLAKVAHPDEVILAVDAQLGQDAVNVARAFDSAVPLTGVVMTRVDGDARGGAAISMRAALGVPILFLGTGEKPDDLEVFRPDRMATRILGMGDIATLVERAQDKIDEREAERLAEKMLAGSFTFETMLDQMRQVKKLGSVSGIMKFIPGVSGMADRLKSAGFDDKAIARQEAMILSMTPGERRNPGIILMGRKKRIASGAGVSLGDVDRLMKQHQKMKSMMEGLRSMGGLKGLADMMKHAE
jgi:signal recognition particle subunit SRP54